MGPDLGPNCFQRLRVKSSILFLSAAVFLKS